MTSLRTGDDVSGTETVSSSSLGDTRTVCPATVWPTLAAGPGLTSALLESLDSPKTSRNFCRLLPITEETCSAASNPGPSTAALRWVPDTLRKKAVTRIRPALLPVPELLLPPGRAGNRHRQLCAILHSLPVCPTIRYLGGRNPNPALHINNLYHSAPLSLANSSLCRLRGRAERNPDNAFSPPLFARLNSNQVQGFCPGNDLLLESRSKGQEQIVARLIHWKWNLENLIRCRYI